MGSSSEQAARVAAFHQLSELLPGVPLEEWRRRCARWKARMSIWVVVGELRALIDRCAQLEQQAAELEQRLNWLLRHWVLNRIDDQATRGCCRCTAEAMAHELVAWRKQVPPC